ncbi:MAG: hypothetical protein GYA33_12660 [Thermogutta sp.]|nr:hypothetical protein [Thermogutta sp.]
MHTFRWFVSALLLTVFLGCGSGTPSANVQPPDPQQEIRSVLQQVAETGVLDSGLMLVRERLEAMRETDPAKAQALLQDLSQLESMTGNPNQAKAKAQEMLGKL